MAPDWERQRLLIWGTTYPEFSRKYYETVCTGAVDEAGRLIRLYPITLRYLKNRFHHYHWILAEVRRNTADRRPESFRIRQDTMEVQEEIGSDGDGWERRAQLLLSEGNVFRSLEELRERQQRDHTSLGLVKPEQIHRVYVRKRPPAERVEWEAKKAEALAQKDFLVEDDSEIRDLAYMPIQYRILLDCDDPACQGGHDLSILDWGTYQLGRKMFAENGADVANRKVVQKIESLLDPGKREPYLILGNTLAYPQNFMVVGFFHPPKERQMLLV